MIIPSNFSSTDFVECFIKRIHVGFRSVFRFMGCHLKQNHINLQRRVAQNAEKLCFGLHLGWHQIQNNDFQWPDILRHGAFMCHDKDIFRFQHLDRRKIRLYFDWHCHSPKSDALHYSKVPENLQYRMNSEKMSEKVEKKG